MTTPKPILLVLGSHRSGTSVMAQLLSVLGYDLGRTLMLPSYDNPRGFWENQKIVDAHDELLKGFNRDWTTAAFLPENWQLSKLSENTLKNLSEILETDFTANEPTLIKDPRLSFLLPLWKTLAKQFGRPLHSIIMLRSPEAVAQSIEKRNGIDTQDGKLIALSYLKSASQNAQNALDNCVIYEHIISHSPQDILAMLSEISPIPLPAANKNMEHQIARIIKGDNHKFLPKSFEQTAYLKMIEAHDVTAPASAVYNLAFSQPKTIKFQLPKPLI